MRALLASPLGFAIGFALGALGGGGSILAVPALVYAAGQTPSDATTTSLLVVAGASLFGLAGHWRAGRVRAGPGVVFGLVGIGGSIAGTALNHRLDDDVLLAGFALLVLVAAWRMLTGCPSCTRVGERQALGAPNAPAGGTALLTRLQRVKPFALQETMVPAAAISNEAQTAIDQFLVAGRRELRDQVRAWHLGPRGSALWLPDNRGHWVSTALGVVTSFVMILVIGIFVAIEPKLYDRGVAWMLPTDRRDGFYDLSNKVGFTLRRLMFGRIIGMVVEGVGTWLMLLAGGVPMAALLGLLTGLLAFVPNIGAIVSGVLMVAVGFSAGTDAGIWAIATYFIVQTVDGYLIVPYVARRTVDLAPALVLGAQLIFGALFGILGLLLADPIVAAVKVALENFARRKDEQADPTAAAGPGAAPAADLPAAGSGRSGPAHPGLGERPAARPSRRRRAPPA